MTARAFNLSLHRSGTKSFVDLCTRNNLRSLHWPGIGFDLLCRPALRGLDTRIVWGLYNTIAEGYHAFADIPAPLVYREAITQAPDASFVLVQRSPQAWVRSVRRHTASRQLDVLEMFQYGLLCGRLVNRLAALPDDVLEQSYLDFNQRVIDLATRRGVRFAAFQLEDPAIGAKLAAFLGLERTDRFRRIDRGLTRDN